MYGTHEAAAKTVVSVAEMARMVGLSRARFYQLIGTTFPWPLYSVSTKRPFYDDMLQSLCLEVRRRNCGIDGKPVLFYARRPITSMPVRRPKPKPTRDAKYSELLDGLRALGLTNVTTAEVAEAVGKLFPHWESGADQSEVLRGLFLHLRRHNTNDNLR